MIHNTSNWSLKSDMASNLTERSHKKWKIKVKVPSVTVSSLNWMHTICDGCFWSDSTLKKGMADYSSFKSYKERPSYEFLITPVTLQNNQVNAR